MYQKSSWTYVFGIIECEGEARPDKKTSYDSAALVVLNELHKRGQAIIGESI